MKSNENMKKKTKSRLKKPTFTISDLDVGIFKSEQNKKTHPPSGHLSILWPHSKLLSFIKEVFGKKFSQ